MSPTDTQSPVLLTVDDLRRWKQEWESLGGQIQEMEKKRDAIRRRLEAAAVFIDPDLAREFVVSPEEPTSSTPVRKRGKWAELIVEYVTRANRGVGFDELKRWVQMNMADESPLTLDRRFYKTIANLSSRGELVKHNGRMFTPAAFVEFRGQVDRGEVEDIDYVSQARRYPLAAAVEDIIDNHARGITSGGIISALRNDPKTSPLIKKGTTQVYNILSRLAKSERVKKEGQTYFPLPKSGEPPSAETQGGSLI